MTAWDEMSKALTPPLGAGVPGIWLWRLLCCLCTAPMAQAPGLGRSVELVDPKVFRVCADPHNLPFSDEQGRGL